MPDFEKSAKQLRDEIRGPSTLPTPLREEHREALYLFLSIDLVNSTQLKTTTRWISILSHLFEASTDYAKSNGFKIWKYRGDEALFFKELFSEDKLRAELDKAYEIAKRLNQDFYNDPGDTHPQAKATMWLSTARSLPRGELSSVQPDIEQIEKSKGSVIISMSDEGMPLPLFEFLGLNIDLGFRVGEKAHPMTITISLQLAHIALSEKYQKKTENSSCRIRCITRHI